MALATFPMTTVTARRKSAEAAAKPARKRSRKPVAPAAAPAPVAPAVDDTELARLRAEFKRHRDVAIWTVGKAEFAAALDRAVVRLGHDRDAMTPARWVEAVEAVLLMCERCGGTGNYCWGGTINGRPVHKATCYHCEGKGQQTIEDAHRNRVYMRHAIRAAAGF